LTPPNSVPKNPEALVVVVVVVVLLLLLLLLLTRCKAVPLG
jgi:hypothetical protein